ncbi:2-hydroxyacid dehydrogenase [Aquincola sp. J276]|uniref:2-hydroxyacid dehydrogenase n=1 Tax=Aquincola sp. J276 TaxID=2898432 RepID=UPI002151B69F|nr:2-hydroxyacid dehydrogenase [Aquincola sp. J276]MCR5865496.1 2-hydroxyacid dehydrogenase [Aquincola sp. J276]
MTTRHRILQTGPLMPGLEARLAATYELHRLDTQPDPEAWLAEHGEGIVGMATSAVHGCSAAQIKALPSLQVVSSFGVGLDRIDLDAAGRRGIAVGYTPDVLNDCVADLAMALMLDVGRGVSAADRFVRRGEWVERKFPLGRKVSGARLGIVGLGRIGRTIAQRATGFDMPTRYHSRNPVAGVPWGYEPMLHELARWADFLVVITAGGAGTHHLIDAQVLEALGPDGFLINVSRGSVIDEQALVKALQEGRIAGAGLDVFDREPHVPGELMQLDNVVLLPHIASGTQETRTAMADLTFDNLAAFFREGRVLASAR